MNSRYVLFAATAALSLSFHAAAAEWLVLGARERGMGGAGVAAADETSAIYWNPASIGAEIGWSLRLNADTGMLLAPNTLSSADTLKSLYDGLMAFEADFEALSDGTSDASTLANVVGFVVGDLSKLAPQDLGLSVSANAGFGMNIGRFGLGVTGTTYVDTGIVADIRGVAYDVWSDMVSGTLEDLLSTTDYDYDTTAANIDFSTTPTYIQDFANDLQTLIIDSGGTANEAEVMAAMIICMAAGDTADTNSLYTELTTYLDGADGGLDLTDADITSMLYTLIALTANDPSVTFDNATAISMRGAGVGEVSLGAAFPILGDKLTIGATAKMMTARTFNVSRTYEQLMAADDPEGEMEALLNQLEDQISTNPLETQRAGFDLGVTYEPFKWLRVAMVGKNLNSPSFDLPDTTDMFVLKPQIRAGVAYKPLPFICLTADVDLTENRSQLTSDFKARFYAVGAEVGLLKTVFLRAGMFGNLMNSGAGAGYTAGLGLKFGPVFSFDVAATLNGDPAKVMEFDWDNDSFTDLPDGLGVSASLQLRTRF